MNEIDTVICDGAITVFLSFRAILNTLNMQNRALLRSEKAKNRVILSWMTIILGKYEQFRNRIFMNKEV